MIVKVYLNGEWKHFSEKAVIELRKKLRKYDTTLALNKNKYYRV